jgi:hypothetical protein
VRFSCTHVCIGPTHIPISKHTGFEVKQGGVLGTSPPGDAGPRGTPPLYLTLPQAIAFDHLAPRCPSQCYTFHQYSPAADSCCFHKSISNKCPSDQNSERLGQKLRGLGVLVSEFFPLGNFDPFDLSPYSSDCIHSSCIQKPYHNNTFHQGTPPGNTQHPDPHLTLTAQVTRSG